MLCQAAEGDKGQGEHQGSDDFPKTEGLAEEADPWALSGEPPWEADRPLSSADDGLEIHCDIDLTKKGNTCVRLNIAKPRGVTATRTCCVILLMYGHKNSRLVPAAFWPQERFDVAKMPRRGEICKSRE